MIDRGRKSGRLTRAEYALTDHQRVELGRDEFFVIKDIAAILAVSVQAIYMAIERGELRAFYVTRGGRRLAAVKGWRIVIWRDALAGTADGDEEDHEAVA